MYKIIYNELVIDVIDKPKYLRYLTKSGRTVLTDKTSAHCIMSSNGKDIYILDGIMLPVDKGWKTVRIQAITENEFISLKEKLKTNNIVYADKNEIKQARNKKLTELSNECKNSITKGVSVLFSDNKYHDFELTIEDQLNLLTIDTEIKSGKTDILYHEKGKSCQVYSAEDISLLIKAANKHKTYHTTYYNMLKQYINNLEDIEIINGISYGSELPFEMVDEFNSLIN